jgi:hypothetical protein
MASGLGAERRAVRATMRADADNMNHVAVNILNGVWDVPVRRVDCGFFGAASWVRSIILLLRLQSC